MTEPGWYVDPDDRALARWHDGAGWTPSWVRRADWPGPAQPPPPDWTPSLTPRAEATGPDTSSTAPRPIVWGEAVGPSRTTVRRKRVGGGLLVLTVALVGLVVATRGGTSDGPSAAVTTTTASVRHAVADPRFASSSGTTCPFSPTEVGAVVRIDVVPAASDGTLCQFRNDDVKRLVNVAFPATSTVADYRSTGAEAFAGCTDLTFEERAPKGTLLVHCTQEPFQGPQVNETLLVFDTPSASGAWVIVVVGAARRLRQPRRLGPAALRRPELAAAPDALSRRRGWGAARGARRRGGWPR